MAKNGQKVAENGPKHFFWKKLFCYFFVTYQGLTRCKKSKKSNERILRSGERTNERTELRRQIYRTNLQSRWVQKVEYVFYVIFNKKKIFEKKKLKSEPPDPVGLNWKKKLFLLKNVFYVILSKKKILKKKIWKKNFFEKIY